MENATKTIRVKASYQRKAYKSSPPCSYSGWVVVETDDPRMAERIARDRVAFECNTSPREVWIDKVEVNHAS